MAHETYRVSVDIGGTFTDLVILNEKTNQIQTLKLSSTPRDPAQAVFEAIGRARDELGIDLSRISQFTHASTVASNALLEGRGARTALVTTAGFEDVLEIQRHKRHKLFDLAYRKVQPLVPRRWVIGAKERIDYRGEVLTALDEAALSAELALLAKEGIEALAICLLFSFKNPAHEQRIAALASEILPDCFITCSSDIFPQFREFERASTTCVNATLGPRIGSYLQRMRKHLDDAGIRVPLQLMQSNGGVISWTEASRMPCRVVESGPAAGVIAAAHFGKLIGRNNLISFDMGGTTAKAGLIENGEVRQVAGQEVGAGINVSRLLQGGGYYVGSATVDLAEVGAGGGSIAWLDSGGVLKVGPRSAGADPGPIAYGLGGTDVTVTDANLLLGRIPADHVLGGRMKLDLATARIAVQENIAGPLGITLDEACAAVIEVANANMLTMLRIVSVEKGVDPSDFTMVAFGGNGPVFAAELAEELDINDVLVPPAPGLLSAQGLLVAEIRYDFRQTHVAPVIGGDLDGIEKVFSGLERKAHEALKGYGIAEESVVLRRSADMRYHHQASEISVGLPNGRLRPDMGPEVAEAFHIAHEKRYGSQDRAAAVEFVTINVSATTNSQRASYAVSAQSSGGASALKGRRSVYFRDSGRTDCALYDRELLNPGDELVGPALIQAADSTTIVPSSWRVLCDQAGNLMLSRKGRLS